MTCTYTHTYLHNLVHYVVHYVALGTLMCIEFAYSGVLNVIEFD